MNKIDRATRKASAMPFNKGKQRIYSIIYDKRGKVLSEAGNSYTKSSPKMLAYSISAGIREKEFWHSECLAIHRLPHGATPYRIVIARVNKQGTPLFSAPCKICINAIKEKGIKVIEYTT